MHSQSQSVDRSRQGAFAAAGGFLFWGIVPIYWKQMQSVSAFELIAHRIVWSLVFLFGVLAWQGKFASLRPALTHGRTLGLNLLSSLLLATNWTVYVWAVNSGHVIETSLGYFLVPLGNVALGAFTLQEKLRRAQWGAIAFAVAGVALMLGRVGHVPWIALTIAATWSGYGLLKKRSVLGSVAGLTVETILLFPVALAWLLWAAGQGGGVVGHASVRLHAFVFSAGFVTAVPLLLFAFGAQRLRLTTLGLLQYIAPSVQFLIGLLLYREPFDLLRLQAFSLIWLGLIIYTADLFWVQRRFLVATGRS